MQFHIGDFIMQHGCAFKITEIKETKIDEKTFEVLLYNPVFEVGKYKKMTCSIPLSSLALTDIRKPFNEETAKEILGLLSVKPDYVEEVNMKTAKSFEDSNINLDLAKLTAQLAFEKKDENTNFSSSKNFLLGKLIESLSQEFAVIYSLDLEEAEKLINDKLAKV